MKLLIEQEKMGDENMDVSKDEIYQIVKEAVEAKTYFIAFLIGLMTLIASVSTFIGIMLLNLRLVCGSVLATILALHLSKYFQKSKEELIRKMVKEYDEKGI